MRRFRSDRNTVILVFISDTRCEFERMKRFLKSPIALLVAIVLFTIITVIRVTNAPSPPPADTSDDETPIVLVAADVSDSGILALDWTPHPEADGYVVVLYTADLVEIDRIGPITDSSIKLRPEERPPAESGDTFRWRVLAFDRGAKIAVSAPGVIEFP